MTSFAIAGGNSGRMILVASAELDPTINANIHQENIWLIMTTESQQGQVSCPYCGSKFKDRIELSKHIDDVHTGLGLLEGDTRRW